MDILKIGTRASELAVWQAKKVQKELENCNVKSVIIIISFVLIETKASA